MAGDTELDEWLDDELKGIAEPLRSEIKQMCLDACAAAEERMRTEPAEDRMELLTWLLRLAREDRDTYRLIREAMWTMRIDQYHSERSRRSVCPSN